MWMCLNSCYLHSGFNMNHTPACSWRGSPHPVAQGMDTRPGEPVPGLPLLLRRLLTAAGLPDAEEYSSHSLRRGFAGWANANGWDVKALMEYVGWRDVHSAMRYLDGSDPFARHRIEASLPPPALPAP